MRKAKNCRMAALLAGAVCLCAMTACEQKQVEVTTTAGSAGDTQSSASAAENSQGVQQVAVSDEIANFVLPQKGDDIVVLTIKDYGDVKIRLFPEETEKGAENFRLLAGSGFYDELIFHRIINGFMIQGGDPRGDGTGGQDAWKSTTGFAQTLSPKLHHFTGAVAYAIGGDKMNKSQFYIVTGEECPPEYLQQITQYYGTAFSPAVTEMYGKVGGAPFLDGGYEVFGQVFDGMEHVLKIQQVETNANDKPKSPVVIEKAVVTQYDGEAPAWLNVNGTPLQFTE